MNIGRNLEGTAGRPDLWRSLRAMPSATCDPIREEKLSPNGFSPDSLEYAIEQLHGLNCAVHRELLRTIAELHACETFTDDGMRSMEIWVSTKLHVPIGIAREWVRVAV